VDLAVLDINLKGENAFPIADALTRHGVPFVFATGYSGSIVPPEHRTVPLFEKPIDLNGLTGLLPQLLKRP
jgi:hypothetical protein